MDYSVDYAKHGTLTPGQVDRVELTYPGGEAVSGAIHDDVRHTSANRAPIIVRNRHATAELWIDFTYPDGGSPSGVEAEADNTFVVPAGEVYEIRSDYPVWEVVLISDEAVPYSVMVAL